MNDEIELAELFRKVVTSIKDHDTAVLAKQQQRAFSDHMEVPAYKILARGIGADTSRNYPCGKKPDLVISLLNQKNVFIEVKCFWPSWFRDEKRGGEIKGFLFGPLLGHKDDGAIALDLRKLALYTPVGAIGGQLIIAGGEPDHGISAQLDEYARVARLSDPPWISLADAWENPHGNGRWFFLRAFFCRQEEMESWWNTIKQRFG